MCESCASAFDIVRSEICNKAISGYSFCYYSTQSSAVVNAVKEQGQTSLVQFMAQFMASNWPAEYRDVVLVPVPSSPANFKKRGFSHTELLARQLARRIDAVSVCNLLFSVRNRSDQVGLSFSEREQNMVDAFKADLRVWRGKNRPVVLIDDVYTSGATLSQAWATLEGLGVNVVGFCVFAQIRPIKPSFTGQESLGSSRLRL